MQRKQARWKFLLSTWIAVLSHSSRQTKHEPSSDLVAAGVPPGVLALPVPKLDTLVVVFVEVRLLDYVRKEETNKKSAL